LPVNGPLSLLERTEGRFLWLGFKTVMPVWSPPDPPANVRWLSQCTRERFRQLEQPAQVSGCVAADTGGTMRQRLSPKARRLSMQGGLVPLNNLITGSGSKFLTSHRADFMFLNKNRKVELSRTYIVKTKAREALLVLTHRVPSLRVRASRGIFWIEPGLIATLKYFRRPGGLHRPLKGLSRAPDGRCTP
jgi:hypothetical protein